MQHRCLPDVTIEARHDAGETGACVLVPSDPHASRVFGVTVSATGAAAGLRFEASAGTEKGLRVLYDPRARTVALIGEEKTDNRTCTVKGKRVRLTVMVVGRVVCAYVNGDCLGAAAAKQPDGLQAYLVAMGERGKARFTDVCCRAIPPCRTKE